MEFVVFFGSSSVQLGCEYVDQCWEAGSLLQLGGSMLVYQGFEQESLEMRLLEASLLGRRVTLERVRMTQSALTLSVD